MTVSSMSPQPRVTTQSAPEGDGSDEGDGGEEVVGASVVSSCDTSPVLEAAKHALDEVAAFVGEAVEGDGAGSPRA